MKRASVVTLALLTAVAGWLRFASVDFGLPDKFRPDEEYLVSRAVGFGPTWNPHFNIYPAAQMYVQHATMRLVAAAEGRSRDFPRAFTDDGLSRAYRVGRLLSAGFGTAAVPAIYWATFPLYGPTAALSSAALLTFATIHVRESKYATTDAAAVFWLTLTLGMSLRIIRSGRYRDSLLAGLFAGLAVATKYPAGAVLATIGVAHIAARRREGRSIWRSFRDIRPYMAVYTAVAVFLCATPFVLLDWQQTANDFAYQRGFLALGVGNTRAGWGWEWLLLRAMPDSLGAPLTCVLVAGLLWGLLRPRPGTLSLLAFVAVACIGIANSRYTFYRYVVVPLPAMVILSGILISDVRALALRRLPRRAATLAVAAGVTLLLVPSMIRDYKLNRLLARRDTRTMAREWIVANVPPGSAIAMTHHATPYGKPQLPPGYRIVPLEDLTALARQDVRWVLSDSSILEFYSPGPTPEQLRALAGGAKVRLDLDPRKPGTPVPVFDESDAFYVPLRHASSMKRPGPRIRIWELDAAPAPANATVPSHS